MKTGSWLQGHFWKQQSQRQINYAEAVKKGSPEDSWSLFLSTFTQGRFLPSAMPVCSPAAKAGYVYLDATLSKRAQAQRLCPQAQCLTSCQSIVGVAVPWTHPSQFLNPQGTGTERWSNAVGRPNIKCSNSNNLCKIAEGMFWLWKELPHNIYHRPQQDLNLSCGFLGYLWPTC